MRAPAILRRLGLAGMAGAGLLIASLTFFVAATLPARAERDDLQAEAARLSHAAAPARQAEAPVQRLPSFAQAPELLKQLNALAQRNGVTVTRSAYQVKAEDTKRIFEVELPLKLTYPVLRTYLRDVLASSPTARLDDLNVHRTLASDPTLDAEVRLSFSFAAAS
ncbi:MAG: GspMb/PilO family protein [Ignavibacteria bacterium]